MIDTKALLNLKMLQNDLTVRFSSDSSNSENSDSANVPPGLVQTVEESPNDGVSHVSPENTRPNSSSPSQRCPKVRAVTLPTKFVHSVSQYVSTPPYTSSITFADDSVSKGQMYTPDHSVYDASFDMTDEEKRKITRRNMIGVFSCIYFLFLIVTGAIIFVSFQSHETRHISEHFYIFISLSGMAWLVFFHVDLSRYKKDVLRNMMSVNEQMDRMSAHNEFNFPEVYQGSETPPYSFVTGRHSGSFYLKTGLAAFCFGHLIKEGLQLGQQVIDFVQEDRKELGCGFLSALILHAIRPIYSFYQLFIVFKYSNIIINRHKRLAHFALMHIMGTCLCYWFGTIMEDALEDYHHKLGMKDRHRDLNNNTIYYTSDYAICSHDSNASYCKCVCGAILSVNNVQAIPYLYPFTIEYNILLAGVWFIVWNNIGKVHHKSHPHHFQHKIYRSDGIEEIRFQSNLVISADCHASNKGLFAGLFVLLASVISIIVFFVAMSSNGFRRLGLSIHYCQEGVLSILAFLGVLVSYRQLSKLDFNKHPITFLDDVLLFIPLPFYFIQSMMTIMAEYKNHGYFRIALCVLIVLQVILQTPMIIDGLRRCSNSQTLRYKKPGREVVTFLLICNLTLWIINTFEAKSVESHYGRFAYFGEFIWLFVSHTTLPLMLFYRFHSSVCLADIWKSAYEKGE